MKKRIKLCFVLSHLPQGGAERQTLNLIKGLDYSKYSITLLLYANTEIFYKEILDLPIELVVNQSYQAGKLIRNVHNALFLRKFLRRNEYDILHTLLYHNGFWVRLLAPKKYYKRIIYSIRNTINDISFAERTAERLLGKRSYVVTNSKKVLEQYVDIVGEKNRSRVTNIYNGIETSRFDAATAPMHYQKIIIGTVGRQTALKNQIQILQAVKHISKTEHINFYLIGDKAHDSSRDNETYIQENNLSGTVSVLNSRPDIETYYSKFNVFVLASITESCPNVLFEAMLSKCLCIVSEGANADNFITDGVNGLVYDGTLSMLILKLNQAITLIKSSKHIPIVNNGNSYVYKNLSIDSMVRSYSLLYENLLTQLIR